MDDIKRGVAATQVLQNEVYQEAFHVIEQRLLAELTKIEISDDRARYIRSLMICNRKIRGYLEQAMTTGHMVEIEEERRSNWQKAREQVTSLFSRY